MENDKIVLGYALLVTRSKGCKIVEAYSLKEKDNEVTFLFERKPKK